jgi:hypothetical protein
MVSNLITIRIGLKNIMNTLTFAHQKKWLLLGLVVLAFLLVACGGTEPTATEEPTAAEAETVDETEEPTEAPTEVPTEIPVVEFDGVVADTLPCEAAIIASSERRLNVRFREPTTDQSLMVGPLSPGTPLRLIELRDVDGVFWYRTINPVNNVNFGWIEARYLTLGEGCVTGAGDAGDDTEATEEAMDDDSEATEEATEESD